jgi:pantoate--beta-alanine ligase
VPLAILRSRAALRARIGFQHERNKRVALVPTMGALHAGHLSLVDLARKQADHVVVSIFVNPTQFGPNEDFSRYPRQETQDAALLEEVGADLLYAPPVDEIYPPGFATEIDPGPIADTACGPFRPGHFKGVATVVAKLLLQSGADVALFGEKDWQQLQVIRHMAHDLDLPVEILGAPIIREPDGLAMSSRNAYLSPEERAIAPAMNRILRNAADALSAGAGIEEELNRAQRELRVAGFTGIDYVEAHDLASFDLLSGKLATPARILGAAWLGRTRLIDNVPANPAG